MVNLGEKNWIPKFPTLKDHVFFLTDIHVIKKKNGIRNKTVII